MVKSITSEEPMRESKYREIIFVALTYAVEPIHRS